MTRLRLQLCGSRAGHARDRKAVPAQFGRVPEAMRSRGVVRASRAGVALPIALVTIAIIASIAWDTQQNAATRLISAASTRDQLKAEYLAVSGIDLLRLFIAREPQLRATVAPLFALMMNHQPPQLPVWKVADILLRPFCDYEGAKASASDSGIDLSAAEGLGKTGGTCESIVVAENGKINVNDPLHRDGDNARQSAAMQLYALMGGYQSPSAYDTIFDQQDPDGQLTSRTDVISDMIDWWDIDQDRTIFDPGTNAITNAGAEDDVYQQYRDPYHVKNAPYDSLEELRLIRGVGDDFWATFVQPNPDDPRQDRLTIYGAGNVNPNEAPPEALLARTCSYLVGQPLCSDPAEAMKFIQILTIVRSIAPIPWFLANGDFLNFLEGHGGPTDLYPMLASMFGSDHSMLFTPVTIPPQTRAQLDQMFVTISKLLTVQMTGTVGRSRVRIRSVINFDERWIPPPPNAGTMPSLGVYQYFRMD